MEKKQFKTKICCKCKKRKKISQFYTIRPRWKGKLYDPIPRPTCKDCKHAYERQYRTSESGQRTTRNSDYLQAYGITLEEFEKRAKEQNGVCAICHQPPVGRKVLDIDHLHGTTIIRGLLCIFCNQGLGRFKDNPALLEAAKQYVERYSGNASSVQSDIR